MAQQKKIDTLKCKHIILSPSFPNNTKVFVDEWVDKYSNWFASNTEYCSVFLENTESNAHLDICVFFDNAKAFENKIRSLKNLNAKFCAQNIATELKHFYKNIPCNSDDILYVTGYNHKDNRCVYSNLPEDFVATAKEYYAENEKLKRVRKFQNTNPLNVKNIVCYLLERSQDLSVKCPGVLTNIMTDEGFSFVGLPRKQMRKAILEFKQRTGQLTLEERNEKDIENGIYSSNCAVNSEFKCAKAQEILQNSTITQEQKLITLYSLFYDI